MSIPTGDPTLVPAKRPHSMMDVLADAPDGVIDILALNTDDYSFMLGGPSQFEGCTTSADTGLIASYGQDSLSANRFFTADDELHGMQIINSTERTMKSAKDADGNKMLLSHSAEKTIVVLNDSHFPPYAVPETSALGMLKETNFYGIYAGTSTTESTNGLHRLYSNDLKDPTYVGYTHGVIPSKLLSFGETKTNECMDMYGGTHGIALHFKLSTLTPKRVKDEQKLLKKFNIPFVLPLVQTYADFTRDEKGVFSANFLDGEKGFFEGLIVSIFVPRRVEFTGVVRPTLAAGSFDHTKYGNGRSVIEAMAELAKNEQDAYLIQFMDVLSMKNFSSDVLSTLETSGKMSNSCFLLPISTSEDAQNDMLRGLVDAAYSIVSASKVHTIKTTDIVQECEMSASQDKTRRENDVKSVGCNVFGITIQVKFKLTWNSSDKQHAITGATREKRDGANVIVPVTRIVNTDMFATKSRKPISFPFPMPATLKNVVSNGSSPVFSKSIAISHVSLSPEQKDFYKLPVPKEVNPFALRMAAAKVAKVAGSAVSSVVFSHIDYVQRMLNTYTGIKPTGVVTNGVPNSFPRSHDTVKKVCVDVSQMAVDFFCGTKTDSFFRCALSDLQSETWEMFFPGLVFHVVKMTPFLKFHFTFDEYILKLVDFTTDYAKADGVQRLGICILVSKVFYDLLYENNRDWFDNQTGAKEENGYVKLDNLIEQGITLTVRSKRFVDKIVSICNAKYPFVKPGHADDMDTSGVSSYAIFETPDFSDAIIPFYAYLRIVEQCIDSDESDTATEVALDSEPFDNTVMDLKFFKSISYKWCIEHDMNQVDMSAEDLDYGDL